MTNPGIHTREAIEALELERLSPRAAHSALTRGRVEPVEEDKYRTDFQRDRDRILHCKAFRRLSHKTQVFLAPEGDHYRTRLTHTLEVAQISRTIARALNLNEDLTEAIALGHDLGHTPFGHTGESALADRLAALGTAYPGAPRNFEHNVQSLRIVERLEYGGKGLNLTWEVRDGILGHTGGHLPATLEGQIVRIADRIAYVNHDIDDAVRGGVLAAADLPVDSLAVLGQNHAERITTMVNDMIAASVDAQTIRMSDRVWGALLDLRSFLFEHVYFSKNAKVEEPKASRVVALLFDHYLADPSGFPPDQPHWNETEPVQRTIDHVSGMTDRFAIREFERIFVPQKWLV